MRSAEKQLVNHDKWLSSVPGGLVGITSPMYDYGGFDYVLIYNVDTSQCNAIPGNFRFVNLLYDIETNQMKIVEYEMDYLT